MHIYIHGFHSIEETLLRSPGNSVLLVSREKGRTVQLAQLAQRKNVRVERVRDEELDRYCEPDRHRGVLLRLESRGETAVQPEGIREHLDALVGETALVLVLDSITDPHNFGAILRSADQFRCDLVVSPGRRSAHDSETVAATSSGANAHVPQVVVPNLVQALELLKEKDFWVYGADLGGTRLDTMDLRGRIALVLGSEGKGMHRLVREKCDGHVAIPAAGNVDSFNVSVAAGIVMYEVRRQQGFPGF